MDAAPALLVALLLCPIATAQGPGGPPGRGEIEVVAQFDADGDGRLDAEERGRAREWLAENRSQRGRGPRGRGGRGGFGGRGTPRQAAAGTRIAPEDVPAYPDRPLYDTDVVRTISLQFENQKWYEELADFYRTDVEVPATMTADGETLLEVGVSFRGNSSYFGVPDGFKRSFGVSIDFVHGDQSLHGYRTLNLLNGHADPSFLRSVLHSVVARQFGPALQASLARVVVNGESWGVFVNVQQFNRDFLREEFGTRKGARIKVPANMRGNVGLTYAGDDPEAYRDAYEVKGGDEKEALTRLIALCRLLENASEEELVAELPSYLDLDGALWFLAVDNALLDGDGYLSRASDFLLYLDPDGRFHPLPYDSNEVLGGRMGGPGGMRGGPGGFRPPPDADRPEREGRRGAFGGMRHPRPEQDPFEGIDDRRRPLVRRLLSVPAWRARYLAYLHGIAKDGLDWDRLGPVAEALHGSIADLVRADTKKLYDDEAFAGSLAALQKAVSARREFLLSHEALAGPWPEVKSFETAEREPDQEGNRALTVTALAGGDAEAVAGTLHVRDRRRGEFVAILMQRDGQQWSATSPSFPRGEKVYWYLELRAADGRIAFAPAGGATRPAAHEFTVE